MYYDKEKSDNLNEENNVTYTGYLSEEELKTLLLNCEALILPSLYEGFGIPPLEALALGKKIIVAKSSCLPEIYKDCAYYVNPYKPCKNLEELIYNNVNSPEELLSKYTWDNAAERLLELLKKYKEVEI